MAARRPTENRWDEVKRESNIADHGIDFQDVGSVFSDDFMLLDEDRDHAEERDTALGIDDLGRLVKVAFTWRGPARRPYRWLISARKAEKREVRDYTRRRK